MHTQVKTFYNGRNHAQWPAAHGLKLNHGLFFADCLSLLLVEVCYVLNGWCASKHDICVIYLWKGVGDRKAVVNDDVVSSYK